MENTNILYKLREDKFLTPEYSPEKQSANKPTSNSLREFDLSDGKYINNIAHELRTPINVVLGSIQLFEMMGDDLFLNNNRKKFKVYNNIMKQNCYRLLRVVNNLIDVSRIEAGTFSLCVDNYDIIDVVKEITYSAEKYTKEKGLILKFHSNCNELMTSFDKDKISRSFLNLLSNAIKFSFDGGIIMVTVKKKGQWVYISVKDTGVGIPADELKNIFKCFAQVDKSLSRSHEGGGIGLAIADSIVSLHDGAISVKSKPGKGSTFTIVLPVKVIDHDGSKENAGSMLTESPAEKVQLELSGL